jgi:hypothetical protein
MDARFPSELAAALARARYMYVTTYSRAGKPGTVPTWLWPHDGDVYFTTGATASRLAGSRTTVG